MKAASKALHAVQLRQQVLSQVAERFTRPSIRITCEKTERRHHQEHPKDERDPSSARCLGTFDVVRIAWSEFGLEVRPEVARRWLTVRTRSSSSTVRTRSSLSTVCTRSSSDMVRTRSSSDTVRTRCCSELLGALEVLLSLSRCSASAPAELSGQSRRLMSAVGVLLPPS